MTQPKTTPTTERLREVVAWSLALHPDVMSATDKYSELRRHLDAARPWLDPMAWEIVNEAEAATERLLELLRDIADSGVAFDDSRLGYVEIQVDRDTWEALHEPPISNPSTEQGAA